MIKFIKQLFCKHEFKWFVINQNGFQTIGGENRVMACPKCEKIKRNSEYFAKYD